MPPVSVSVVVPLYNDQSGIADCLDSIRAQRTARGTIVEIVVADGGSDDGSREVVEAQRIADPRIRLVENPGRTTPRALNRAIDGTTGEVIVRVDSHARLTEDYVECALGVLAVTGADVVGGPMRPIGTSPTGAAIAWALCSRFGIGGSRFHDASASGPSDSVYMGVFPRATFDRFGRFDERFVRNQDDELTYRIRERGGTVWLDPSLRSWYTPRDSFRALARQFFGYGRYKPLVLREHPTGLRARHLAPAAALLGWSLLPLAVRRRRYAVPALAHVIFCAAAGRSPLRSAALLTMHLGYGAGFLFGISALAATDRPGAAAGEEPARAAR